MKTERSPLLPFSVWSYHRVLEEKGVGKEQLIIWIFLSRTSSLLPPTSIPNRHLRTMVLLCYCTNRFTYSYSPIDFKVPKSRGYVSPDHSKPRPFVTVERKEDNAEGKQMERKEGKDRKSTFSDQGQEARQKENRGYGHWSFSRTNSLEFFLKESLNTTLLIFSLALPTHLSPEITSFQSSVCEAYLSKHCQGYTFFFSFSILSTKLCHFMMSRNLLFICPTFSSKSCLT